MIRPEKNAPLNVPAGLEGAFFSDEILKSRFKELTLSKQRDFAEYIYTAKQDKTRVARITKIIPVILRGEGLNDKSMK